MINYQELANADVGKGASSDNVHEEFKELSVEQRLEHCFKNSLPYNVAIINVTGELNVGNIIRSASLCGARKVHVLGRRKYDSRGAVGSENYINVVREDLMLDETTVNVAAVADYFDKHCLYPIFIEQNENSLNINSLQMFVELIQIEHLVPCLVFGNEGRGIPKELIQLYEKKMCIELKQMGVIRSFNVGSTAAIILHKMMSVDFNVIWKY
jgi:tRNA G18 (ribose-2'-O)-methylase SpoU